MIRITYPITPPLLPEAHCLRRVLHATPLVKKYPVGWCCPVLKLKGNPLNCTLKLFYSRHTLYRGTFDPHRGPN